MVIFNSYVKLPEDGFSDFEDVQLENFIELIYHLVMTNSSPWKIPDKRRV